MQLSVVHVYMLYLDGGLGLNCLGCRSLSCSSSIAAIVDMK